MMNMQYSPTLVRNPTEEEFAELVRQTELFFTDHLSNLWNEQVDFTITWAIAFDPTRLDAQATVSFPSGTFPTTLAGFTQFVNQEMYQTTRSNYVQNYVHSVDDNSLYQNVTSINSIGIMHEVLPTPFPTDTSTGVPLEPHGPSSLVPLTTPPTTRPTAVSTRGPP